jgi:hypothetical protein
MKYAECEYPLVARATSAPMLRRVSLYNAVSTKCVFNPNAEGTVGLAVRVGRCGAANTGDVVRDDSPERQGYPAFTIVPRLP